MVIIELNNEKNYSRGNIFFLIAIVCQFFFRLGGCFWFSIGSEDKTYEKLQSSRE